MSSWLERVRAAELTGAPFGVGFFKPGVTLLVGEQASDPQNAPEQQPFCSDKGCSGWLNRLLLNENVDESKLFWVNALYNDDSVVDLAKLVTELQPSRVISLGNVAKKLLSQQGIQSEHTYHPQYWKRFKSKYRYPLLDLLHERVAS